VAALGTAVQAQEHDGRPRIVHTVMVLEGKVSVGGVGHVEAQHVQRQVIHLRDARRVLDTRGKAHAVHLEPPLEAGVGLGSLAVARNDVRVHGRQQRVLEAPVVVITHVDDTLFVHEPRRCWNVGRAATHASGSGRSGSGYGTRA
jgi:hypothetical protein